MYIRLTYLFIFFTTISFAQLTVKNDNYIFVKDVQLFVVDDVDLLDSNSRIHLRNDAQLLQENETPDNSGVGELSVRQTGTVNQFAYNYWCSPVGNTDANDNNNRDFRVNQLDDPDATDPIASTDAVVTNSYNGTSSPLTIANYWIWTYVASTAYADWIFAGFNGDIAPGLGFSMKGNNSGGQTYEFRGKPNTGTISNTVANGEFTLIGNPYPSAIDAYEFIYDTDNQNSITGDLYYWEQAPGANSHNLTAYVGGYAVYTIDVAYVDSFTPATFDTYNGDGSLNTVGASSTTGKTAYRYIPIGQGFMVEGTSATNTLVYTKNSHRTYYKQSEAESFFFRPSNNASTRSSETEEQTQETQYNEYGLNIVPDDYKRFRVNVDFNDLYTRQLLLNFHHTATEGFDYGLEGKHPDVISSDAYLINDVDPLVIQAFDYNIELTIPVVVKVSSQQPVQFRLFDVQNFNVSQPIFLHDILNDTYVDLRTQNYSLNLDSGTYTNRFEITFQDQSTLSNEDLSINSISVLQDNNNNALIIKNPEYLEINTVSIYDASGKRVFNQINLGNSNRFKFPTSQLSSGIYIAKIEMNNSKSLSKKIIVNPTN